MTALVLVRRDTDFDCDPQRFGCRIGAKQHSHGLFRNGGEAGGCPVEASSTSAPLDLVRCARPGAADLGEIGSRFATERKSQRDAETPGLPGASKSLLDGRLETAPIALKLSSRAETDGSR